MAEPINNPQIRKLVETQVQRPTTPQQRNAQGVDFGQLLEKELGLKVSGHAQSRLKSRGIDLAVNDWNRVKDGIDRAAEKGSRESLVMLDDVALVVSVKNRTVITAVAKEQLKENVFTNIDSAVFV
jgi:flagellar operon protein